MKQGPWNRCDYCGRFISYQAFDSKLAERLFGHAWNPWAEDVDEVFETYHKACKENK